jgi:hypothetical protein
LPGRDDLSGSEQCPSHRFLKLRFDASGFRGTLRGVRDADVVVVGFRCAGAPLSLALHRAGVKVIAIE